MMKIIKWIALFLFTIFLTSQILVGDSYYDIRHYDVNMVVDEDNNYAIKETIDVEFYSDRHGIYRDIPTMYNNHYHPIKDIRVTDGNGVSYKSSISKTNETTSIQIGDPDRTVSGFVTYVIEYTYMGGMDYNQTQDELYFNLIGNEWTSNIDGVSFTITMPKAFDPTKVNFTSGHYGSTNTSNVVFEVNGNVISGRTLEPLYEEFLTVALPLEEGYYEGVSSEVNVIGLYLLLLLAIVIAFVSAFINRQYKLNNLIVPVIHFAPPEQLNPPEVAYVYGRESLSHSDVATLVLSWASEGYLTIEEVKNKLFGTHMVYHKVAEMPNTKPKYEKTLFNKMFALGDGSQVSTDDLSNTFYAYLQGAAEKVRKRFMKDKEILVNQVQVETKLIAVGYSLIYMFAFTFFAMSLLHNGFVVNFIPIAMICLGTTIYSGIILYIFKRGVTLRRSIGAFIASLVFVITIVILILLPYGPLIDMLVWQSPNNLVLLLLSFCFFGIGQWMILSTKDYTAYSRDLLGRIEGFRTFLKTAKTDQIEVLHKENPEYIYAILPYAMIFNLTSVWEKHVNKMSVPAPAWYSGMGPFRASSFTHDMNRSLASARSQPSSSGSGSSSGGSSGGGGGGGGGGSW